MSISPALPPDPALPRPTLPDPAPHRPPPDPADALPLLDTDPRPALLGLTRPALAALLDGIGVGARHAGRVFGGLHRHRLPLDQIADLGRHARTIAAATRPTTLRVDAVHTSDDDTEKLVFALADGARVEGVLIPMKPGRVTLCVSSQVGCAMACTFCATGTLGLTRGLGADEIIAQVHAAQDRAAATGQALGHIVFMGMGEPLHHYPATRDAVRILRDEYGPCFKARHITVSTVGVVPKMRTFARDFGGRVQLALSLHAGTDATRRRIIPLAERYDMASLRQACLDHPLPGTRRLMIEYVVLPGVNDSVDEITALAQWTRGIDCIVNLIPFNPFPGATFRAPSADEVRAVAAALQHAKVPYSVRWPRGDTVAGACGQLALTEVGPAAN